MTQLIDFYSDLFAVPPKVELDEFEWDDAEKHISPVRETPLKSALMGKTNCALILISAGTLVWAARSLDEYADVLPCVQMAETLLCWQADPHYYDRNSPWFEQESKAEFLEEEVAEAFVSEATTVFQMVPGFHTAFPNVTATADLICLLRHVLDKDATAQYKVWLESFMTRLDQIAPNPFQTFLRRYDFDSDDEFTAYVAQNMGQPLPPSYANTSTEVDPTNTPEMFSKYVRSVDWKANIFLNDPDKMIALGFEGQPYT